MTREEVVETARKLILKPDYKGLLDFLPDALLRQYPEYKLYHWRGLAHKMTGDLDKAIADYSESIKLYAPNIDSYFNRGLVWNAKGEYDKALSDFNAALSFDLNDGELYNGRGTAWDNLKEYDKAIADYNKALELKPNFAFAFNNRGEAWFNKGEYDKAIADYTQSIATDPAYADAYYNRSLVYKKLGDFDSALRDILKSIEMKPDFALAYAGTGDLYSERGDYAQAVKYYELAMEYEPGNKLYRQLRDEAKAKQGEAVILAEGLHGFSAAYVENELRDVAEEEKKPIRKACAGINELVEHIRHLILYKGDEPLVHYTRLRVADIVVTNPEARLRYSNVVFMNDPEEGKVLTDHLLDDKLRDAFDKGNMQEDNNVYLGSFLPEDKADYLVMWRTYGKNELNEEATGCSITLHRDFFDRDGERLYRDMRARKAGERSNERDPTEKQALYHVIYYDKQKGTLVADGNEKMIKEVEASLRKLQDALKHLLALKNAEDTLDAGLKNTAINKFVYRYISELRYFFKSADYQFEQELRVIKYYLPDNPVVKSDYTTTELPRRLFIESTNKVRPSITKIILGPKVHHPERWMYLDATMKQNGHNLQLEASKCRFQ